MTIDPAFDLRGKTLVFPRKQQPEKQPCRAAISPAIQTSKNVRHSTSKTATNLAVCPKKKPRRAPGRRSTKKQAAATNRAVGVTYPIRTFRVKKVGNWA